MIFDLASGFGIVDIIASPKVTGGVSSDELFFVPRPKVPAQNEAVVTNSVTQTTKSGNQALFQTLVVPWVIPDY